MNRNMSPKPPVIFQRRDSFTPTVSSTPMTPTRIGPTVALAGLAAAGAGAYALAEAKSYRLVHHEVPVGSAVPPLRILHLSDTHLAGSNRRLIGFLERLPGMMEVTPDLVLATGDLIENDTGIEPLVSAFENIDARLGRFYVLGSHDYYRSSLRGVSGIFKALLKIERAPVTAHKNSTDRLEKRLAAAGWTGVINRTEWIDDAGTVIRIAGTDDPYLRRHRTDHAARAEDEALAIALIHAPDIVSEWLLAGFDLVLAGHTHAGQVRAPLVGALVTNCSLPLELAGGLQKIGRGWLHVSPGLGTSRFSPIRFLARPEATLLTLRPT
ncbi:MAG: hypothetical protein GEU71_14215 [Actinobacteria bacterium]|nr:hypothetical protein [Actinomycetota bacterium]